VELWSYVDRAMLFWSDWFAAKVPIGKKTKLGDQIDVLKEHCAGSFQGEARSKFISPFV
jgi:hypothetical protein